VRNNNEWLVSIRDKEEEEEEERGSGYPCDMYVCCLHGINCMLGCVLCSKGPLAYHIIRPSKVGLRPMYTISHF